MLECKPEILSAYLDGALAPETEAQVRQHLIACRSCAADLQALTHTAELLRTQQFETLSGADLDRLYAKVDQSIDELGERRLWRLGLLTSGLAASVLILGLIWLNELPAAPPRRQRIVSVSAPWERIAVTFLPDPLETRDGVETDQLIRLANAEPFAEWMVRALNEGNP